MSSQGTSSAYPQADYQSDADDPPQTVINSAFLESLFCLLNPDQYERFFSIADLY